MSSFINQTYDDTDFEHIQYSSFWNHGTWNASNAGTSGTLSTSNVLFDANLTFVFPEAAIGFYYYAIRRSNGARYGMCIDCDENAPNYDIIDAVNITDDGKNPPVLLYSKQFSTPGIHRINLQNQPDTRFPLNNSQINIDRFELEVVDPNAATSLITVTGSAGSSPSSPTSSSSSLSSSPSSPNNTGPIIGGILGGLTFLLLILSLLLWYRRRNRLRRATYTITNEGFDPNPIQPTQHQSGNAMSEVPTTSTMAIAHAKTRHIYGVQADTSPHHQRGHAHNSGPSFESSHWAMPTNSSGGSGNNANGGGSVHGSGNRSRREVDAGPLNPPMSGCSDTENTLPPEYDQLFHREAMSTSSGQFVPVPPEK